MLAPFLGFGPRALDWFRGLEADNSKAYFETHRAVWETEVRGPLERLLEELASRARRLRQDVPPAPGHPLLEEQVAL